jgi:hypothetical protein
VDRALKQAAQKKKPASSNGKHNSGPEANGQTPKGGKEAAHTPADPFDPGITLEQLMLADLPAGAFALAGVLPEGLSILAGRPKGGKSWLAMMMALCVACGLPCLGGAAGAARPVLHLALEDTRRRYSDRA